MPLCQLQYFKPSLAVTPVMQTSALVLSRLSIGVIGLAETASGNHLCATILFIGGTCAFSCILLKILGIGTNTSISASLVKTYDRSVENLQM